MHPILNLTDNAIKNVLTTAFAATGSIAILVYAMMDHGGADTLTRREIQDSIYAGQRNIGRSIPRLGAAEGVPDH